MTKPHGQTLYDQIESMLLAQGWKSYGFNTYYPIDSNNPMGLSLRCTDHALFIKLAVPWQLGKHLHQFAGETEIDDLSNQELLLHRLNRINGDFTKNPPVNRREGSIVNQVSWEQGQNNPGRTAPALSL